MQKSNQSYRIKFSRKKRESFDRKSGFVRKEQFLVNCYLTATAARVSILISNFLFHFFICQSLENGRPLFKITAFGRLSRETSKNKAKTLKSYSYSLSPLLHPPPNLHPFWARGKNFISALLF